MASDRSFSVERLITIFRKDSLFWIVAIAGLILDQGSKQMIVQRFSQPGHSWQIWPGVFHLTYVLNTGAAFSSFRGGANWLKWLSLGVSVMIIFFVSRSSKLSRLEQFAYGCILAGAMGNGIDRFFLGHVIDFLDFYLIKFPVFNLADTFINIGIIGLLISNFYRPR